MSNVPFHSRLLDEQNAQEERPAHKRRQLLKRIGRRLGSTVVSLFTSFVHPVMMDDADADMLEDLLQSIDIPSGLCLIINSPGGQALAAERIVRICRTYSKENFTVLIPRRAKSAATMVALGELPSIGV